MFNNYKNPIIIFNPNSRGKKSKNILDKCKKIFLKEKFFENIDIFESSSKQHTIDAIIEIHNSNYDLIISIGGDGSISTICNGLMKIEYKKRLPLFLIPGGSGNSFLRDFNIYSIKDAINNYKKNKSRMIDLLLVENIDKTFKWYCINVVGLGFISNIAKYGEEKFNNFGAFKYVLATLFALKEFKPYKTRITYDNNKEFNSENVYFISLSNSKFTGGKIMIAPDAKYDDGLMDVIILSDLNRLMFLNGFRKVFKGNHIHDKGCYYFKTKSIEIHSTPDYNLMPDGDLESNSPIKVDVVSKQIKLVL